MTGTRRTVTSGPRGLRSRVLDNGVGRIRWQALAVTRGARVSSSGPCVLGPRSHVDVAPEGELRLGRHVVLRADLQCSVRGRCEIGDDVFVNRWCYLSVFSELVIGAGVRLGERVSIHDENHASSGADYHVAPVSIGAGAWLGANVVVLPGVSVGEGAVVAAGAAVRESVPAYTLVAGVPARVVRDLRAPA